MSSPEDQGLAAPPPPGPPLAEPPAPRPTKLRPAAIALFVLGLILLGGGIAKLIAGGTGAGIGLACFGIALFALSFVPLPRADRDREEPMSPVQKMLGIFFEPARVFRNLRSHPHWVAAFIVICILSVIYTFAFTRRVTPERIVNHTIDKLAELGPPFAPPPEVLETMRAQRLEEAKNPVQRVMSAVTAVSVIFFFTGLLAALYLLGILAFGGRINFWQAFAVTIYAALPVVIVQKLLSLVILYIKAPEDLHPILNADNMVQDNLGVLFTPAEHPVLFVLASAIGVLSFYGLWLKAKGLHYGAQRVSSGAAWGVAITFWLLGLLLGATLTALFPNFIS